LLEYKALVPAQSDHFDGQRFFNPTGPALQPLTAVPRMLLTPRAKWPRYVPEVPRQPPPRDTARPVVTLSGMGHSWSRPPPGKSLPTRSIRCTRAHWIAWDLGASGLQRSRSTFYRRSRSPPFVLLTSSVSTPARGKNGSRNACD